MEENGRTWPANEEIEALVAQGRLDELRQLLADIHPADIAQLLDELSPESALTVFDLLSMEVASEVLDETGGLVRQELVEKVDDEKLADLLDELPMDDAAEFLEDLPDPVASRLLGLMEPEEAKEVRELLGYEEETAGRLMTRDVAALRRHWTVAETFDYLHSLEDAETLHYLYVVDRNDRLIGVAPLRALILSQPEATIESIMNYDAVSVPVTADQEELAEMVARYDYFAIPVVDEEGRLLGVVTVDDVLDIVEEEATEDIQRLGGSEPLAQPYFALSTLTLARKRVGWLLLLFIAATITVNVLSFFEDELALVIALSFFIPLVTNTGGNAGSQTVATIIRAITIGEVNLDTLRPTWQREVSVGLILGLSLGLIGFSLAFLLGTGYEVSFVVAATLPLVVILAVTIATVIPILANHLDVDPTVISGPMITTIIDVSAILIYFLMAKLILGI